MSSLTDLSAEIVNVLSNIEQEDAPAFAEINNFPNNNFGGTPAATVVPSDNQSDYATIVQDLRTYAFDIDLYIPIEQEDNGVQTSFEQMSVLYDSCIDAFDNCNDLNAQCDMLRPVTGAWGVVQSNQGELLTARIILRCAKTVVTNNG